MIHLSAQWLLHNGNTAFLGFMYTCRICDDSIIIYFYVDIGTNVNRLLGKTAGEIPQEKN